MKRSVDTGQPCIIPLCKSVRNIPVVIHTFLLQLFSYSDLLHRSPEELQVISLNLDILKMSSMLLSLTLHHLFLLQNMVFSLFLWWFFWSISKLGYRIFTSLLNMTDSFIVVCGQTVINISTINQFVLFCVTLELAYIGADTHRHRH